MDARLNRGSGRTDTGCMPQPSPLERGFFRRALDGTTVFFPWGLTRRGYRLDGDVARQRAARAVSLLMGGVIAIGTWTAHVLQRVLDAEAASFAEAADALVLPLAALALAIVGYVLWVSRFVERFPPSDLVVSREERLREAAEVAEPRKLALIGGVVVVLGLLALWIEARTWWLGALAVVAGAGLVFWSRVLERAASENDRSGRVAR